MATFLERYQAGEYVAVWNDLMALPVISPDDLHKANISGDAYL